MSWCPECKAEYVEGILTCADCGLKLLDELPADEESPAVAGNEEAAFMEFIKNASADPKTFAEAPALASAEAPEEMRERLREAAAREMAAQMRSQPAKVYRYNDERAEEHRSSAFTLILVGGGGLIVIILFFMDMFPIQMAGFSKYMVSGVMGVLFILFLIMGLISMKKSQVLAVKAGKEKNLTKEIKNWCLNNLSAEALDETVFTDGEAAELSDEIKYFRRCEKIQEILSNQFLNLEEGYLDSLIDEVYPEIFE